MLVIAWQVHHFLIILIDDLNKFINNSEWKLIKCLDFIYASNIIMDSICCLDDEAKLLEY